MKLLLTALAALALAPVAQASRTTAGPVTMTSADVPLVHASTSSRSLAALPRFDMVALHWQGSGTPSFRTRSVATGRWSAWQAADDDWGYRPPWHMQGSPSWVGAADAVQYHTSGRVTKLRAYLLDSRTEQLPERRLALVGGPTIIPRAGWGANEEIRRAPPLYADAVRFALVHHTVNANSYTPAQSAAIVRGIELYHVRGNGWNDIGYNFLVDKYGQVFEGRYGGIDKAVVGAHSAGFNTGSVGVAVIGTYAKTQISAAAKSALEQLLAWRLDVAHVDPLSSVAVTSGGNSKYPVGTHVTLRAISGHRDTYLTECPGNSLYAQLPQIAKDVAGIGLPKLYAPAVTGTLGGPIRFTGRLSGPLPWTVTVTDTTGTTVATGTGNGAAIDWTWDASQATGTVYNWSISAGPSVRGATGRIGSKRTQLTVTDAAVTPAATAADAQVAFTLSTTATVTGSLLDANGVLVAPLFTVSKPAGKQTLPFTVPATVADGTYTVQLVAQSVDGQQVTATVPLQVDRAVASFTTSAPAFSPNGDGVQDTLGIDFQVGEPAQLTLSVTQNGTILTTLFSGEPAVGTDVPVTWDGTLAGAAAPDGAYVLTLSDGVVTRSLPVALDRRPPALAPVSWAHLRFTVGEPATVTLAVGSQSYVKKVKAPGRLYFWLKSMPAHFTVTAQDAAGNVTTLTR